MPKKLKDEEIEDGGESAPEVEAAPKVKAPKQDGALVVYADFEHGGKEYKAGDMFAPPSELTYDKAFTEFRNAGKKKNARIGLAFTKAGEVDRKTGEREYKTFVLPVSPKE